MTYIKNIVEKQGEFLVFENRPIIVSGYNMQGGSVIFNKEKTKNILFDKAFLTVPFVDITLENAISSPPYRINVTKTGFTLKTSVNYTGIIEWKATAL